MTRQRLTYALMLTLFSLTPSPVGGERDRLLEVGLFSAAPPGVTVPAGWKPIRFKNIGQHTHYAVVKDGDAVVIKADSQAAASGLTKEINIDPREYPIVRWRWKVENVLAGSDVRRKDGDDYPARLYITFQYEPDKVSVTKKLKYKAGRVLFGDIPIAALNYIWDTKTPVGTVVENVYTDFAQMIVVESGPEKLRRWVNEERNVHEDYKRAFGGEPPRINGVGIMTDTDNTKERATAYYGDITFGKE